MQSHYPHSISAPASFQSANAVPAANINFNSQLVHPNSNFQGNLPVNQPVGSLGSWGSWPLPPTANGNGIAVPTYGPGHIVSSGGDSHLQQQSLLQTSHGLLMSHPVQQLMQTPSMNASLPGNATKFAESSPPMLPTIGTGSRSLSSTVPPPSALPSSVPIGQHATLPSKLSPSPMPNNASNVLPTVTLGSNSPLASPLVAYSLDANPVVPPVVDKPKLVFDPVLPHQIISQSMSSIVGSSTPVHSEASVSSLLTPAQLLRPGSTGHSSPHWQTTHKDIEVVQTLTSESVSSDSESAEVLAHPLPLPLPSAEKVWLYLYLCC